jgi:hypothetical protein
MRRKRECKKVLTFLIDYFEGTLDEQISQRFELHILDCEECKKFVETYRKCVEVVKNFEVDIPEELEEKLYTFIKNELKK